MQCDNSGLTVQTLSGFIGTDWPVSVWELPSGDRVLSGKKVPGADD
jgi:hypothetical protein